MRVLADSDLALLHRLQERGLGLWRGAVDVVGENHASEDRAADEAELAPALLVLVEDHGSGDVGRHQVRCELDTLEADVQNLSDARYHERLGQAGNADEQTVASRE